MRSALSSRASRRLLRVCPLKAYSHQGVDQFSLTVIDPRQEQVERYKRQDHQQPSQFHLLPLSFSDRTAVLYAACGGLIPPGGSTHFP